MLFLYLISVLAIIWLVRYHWNRRKFYVSSYKLPGPLALPLIGNALLFAGGVERFIDVCFKLFKTYNTPYRFWMGPKYIIVISKPKDLAIMLNSDKCTDKDDLMDFSSPLIGKTGLIIAKSKIWKMHRKMLNPAFNKKILDSFVNTFSEHSVILVEKLKAQVGKGEFDMRTFVAQASLDLLCETNMGTKKDAKQSNSAYSSALGRVLQAIFARTINMLYHKDFIYYNLPAGKRFLKDLEIMHTYVEEVLRNKKIEIENENKEKESISNQNEEDNEIPKRKPFLDYLMEISANGNNYTDEDVLNEVNTFMSAGSDTMPTAICFTCMLLGSHPDIQAQAHAEVDAVFGPSARAVTADDLPHLQYLERVLKESMRLFPPTPVLIRSTAQDVQLDTCFVPAGTALVYLNMYTHRDPELWPQPLRFDPDRFLPEEAATRHPYAYIPFSAGLRNCIGSRYAMMAMKVILCTLLRTYSFKSSCDIETIRLENRMTLKPTLGFLAEVHLRREK